MRILNHDMQRFLTYTNFEIDIDNEKEDILKNTGVIGIAKELFSYDAQEEYLINTHFR